MTVTDKFKWTFSNYLISESQKDFRKCAIGESLGEK